MGQPFRFASSTSGSHLAGCVCRKATGALKLIHDVFGKDAAGLKHYLREFDDAIHTNRDLKNYISKVGSACRTSGLQVRCCGAAAALKGRPDTLTSCKQQAAGTTGPCLVPLHPGSGHALHASLACTQCHALLATNLASNAQTLHAGWKWSLPLRRPSLYEPK